MANPGDKNKYLLFLLTAATLFLFGCLGPVDNGNVTNVVIQNTTNITDITNITDSNLTNITETPDVVSCEEMTIGREECLIARAVETQNIGDCRPLIETYYDRCILDLSKLSYAYCGQLTNETAIDDCFLNVSPGFSLEVCDSIINSTKKEQCKLGFISDLCKPISNETERLICDAIEKNDKDLCESNPAKDLCYLRFSVNKSKIDICDKVSIEGTRFACYGLLDSGQACERMDAGVLKDNCYKIYAVEKPDCSACKNVEDTVYRGNCFAECAITSGDKTNCAKPEKEINRDVCYDNFATAEKNAETCNNIKYLSLRRFCIEKVAISTSSPNKCDIIGETYGFGQGDISACYYNVIGIANVSAVNCLAMNASSAKDQCIFTDVKRTLDKTTCTSIGDEILRKTCVGLQ